jgi:hypothetical protein
MKWEHARERRGDEPFKLFDRRMTRLEVAAFVTAILVFIAATKWAYPGVGPVIGFAAFALVRLVSVGVLRIARPRRN